MFYVQRGSVPRARATRSTARPTASLYAEELFGVEGFTGRSTPALPPGAADADAPDRARRPGHARDASTTSWHHHRLVKTGGLEASRSTSSLGRYPAVLQQRRRDGRDPAGRLDARRARSIATATPTRCSSSTRAAGTLRERASARSTYGPGDYLVIPIGTTWRLDRRTKGVDHRILYLESPVGDRSRRSATATSTASCWNTRPMRARILPRAPLARRAPAPSEVRIRAKYAPPAARPTLTTTTPSTWSAGTATYTPWASTSPTSSRSPGASTSRRRSTRHSRPRPTWSVRSCRASTTTTHWQFPRPTTTATSTARNCCITSTATSCRGAASTSLVHAPPARHPARPPSRRGGSLHRQGSDRGTGGDDRHLPSAVADEGRRRRSRTRRYPYSWLPPDDARRGGHDSSPSADRRRCRTESDARTEGSRPSYG